MIRVGVLASGRGSNFKALYQAASAGNLDAEVVCLGTDSENCGAWRAATDWQLATLTVGDGRKKGRLSRASEQQLCDFMQSQHVDLVCLAGFMRIIGGPLLEAFPRAILNIHPSLLPAFPGLRAPQQALDYGAKITGCTVHFVDRGIDSGPIVMQAAVDIEENDDADTLAARILVQEHSIYAQAVQLWATHKLQLQGRLVHRTSRPSGDPAPSTKETSN